MINNLQLQVGRFEDGVMAGAQEARVEQVVRDEDGIYEVSRFSDPIVPPLKYSRATKTSMGEDLLVRDPYESRCQFYQHLISNFFV